VFHLLFLDGIAAFDDFFEHIEHRQFFIVCFLKFKLHDFILQLLEIVQNLRYFGFVKKGRVGFE
jgi:hypothetical protein